MHAGYANELAVTGATSPLSVNTGAAIVDGIPYENTAAVNVAVPTPSVGTTGHRVVLRANWAAQTVRIFLISSTDGVAAIPALTQTPGTTYDIPLATLTITTLGAITVTDARSYLHYTTRVNTVMIDDDAVTPAKIPNRTRKVFVPARDGTNTTDSIPLVDNIGFGFTLTDNKICRVKGGTKVPSDFVSVVSLKAILYPSAGGNAYIDTTATYAQPLALTHSDFVGATAVAVSSGVWNEVQALTFGGAATPLAAEDDLTVTLTRTATNVQDTVNADIHCPGFVLEYIADM